MHCEIDPFCNRVMKHHFPNSFQHEDIRTTDFSIWRGRIDLITGGFPCQPFSSAGKRKGTEDDRNLWPQMFRAIKEIQPRWVVAENVYGITNWSKGLVFEQVQHEMENEGYQVGAYLLPACGVEAPHERTRTWFIAYAAGHISKQQVPGSEPKEQTIQEKRPDEFINVADPTSQRFAKARESINGSKEWDSGAGGERDATNPLSLGQPGSGWTFNPGGTEKDGNWKASWAYDDGRWPTKPGVCHGANGFSGQLVDFTFLDWYEGSLTALGNAIVPQVAFELFKAIEQYNLNPH